MTLWQSLLKLVSPRKEPLGHGPLLSSFQSLANDLDPKWIRYVGDCIETGRLTQSSRGNEWYFIKSEAETVPQTQLALAEWPVFHAITECGVPLLCTASMYGGVTFHCKTALKSLKTVALAKIVAPPTTGDVEDLFYWGLSPGNPAFARKRVADILAAVHSIPHTVWGPAESTRSYFEGDPKPMHALYVATYQYETNAIAMQQYFLDDTPQDSDPVYLADGEHTVLEGAVSLAELRFKLARDEKEDAP